MSWNDALRPIQDDGLPTSEVGPWMEDKHKLLLHYASLFLRAMRNKWDVLAYLDLFAGPGQCRIRGASKCYRSSPTAILSIPEIFDRYVFCEADPSHSEALRTRVQRDAPGRRVTVLSGDANARVDDVLAQIPVGNKGSRVLSFCFLDPYQVSNVKFRTIETLAARYMDFLVLIPSGMDAHRNEQNYIKPSNTSLDDFLGNREWRQRWGAEKNLGHRFEEFVVKEFGRSMARLRYIDPGAENTAIIRSRDKNLLLYRLVLYSRNKLGAKFWKESRIYTDPQRSWDF